MGIIAAIASVILFIGAHTPQWWDMMHSTMHGAMPIAFFGGIIGLISALISRKYSNETRTISKYSIVLNAIGILGPVFLSIEVMIALGNA